MRQLLDTRRRSAVMKLGKNCLFLLLIWILVVSIILHWQTKPKRVLLINKPRRVLLINTTLARTLSALTLSLHGINRTARSNSLPTGLHGLAPDLRISGPAAASAASASTQNSPRVPCSKSDCGKWKYVEEANKYISLAENFPRKACPPYSHFYERFNKQKCWLEKQRDTANLDCFAILQEELDSILNYSSSEWLKLPANCSFMASMYKKRANLEIGRWSLIPKAAYYPVHSTDVVLSKLQGKSVYYFGDSWIREIFATTIALLTGSEMDDEIRTFRQGDDREHAFARNKNPYETKCYTEIPLGFNISQCGWMPMKIWNSNDKNMVRMVFNMRTFYTMGDEFENISFARLNPDKGHLQPQFAGYLSPWPAADVLIISESIWGPTVGHGSAFEQMKALYHRTLTGFSGKIIWVTTDRNGEFHDWIRRVHIRDRVILFDRVWQLQQSKKLKIASEHGYRGDVVYSQAKLLLELLTVM
jgi:hypothetical protein